MRHLEESDLAIFDLIKKEGKRQEGGLELIASENFTSRAVMEAQGSILTNKYAEGYSGRRYYGGCEFVDGVEDIAIERLKKLFNVKYANVQPHSGSQANMAVFFALLQTGDKILAMDLCHGGHLTHGFKLNFSGNLYQPHFYGVSKGSEVIDYDEVRRKALEVKPKLIIAGGSAYSRKLDFKRFREIADEVGAYLMVDMAHIAGLVAAGIHPSPAGYAHVMTSTTHKTLRGPRGGIILTSDEEISKKVNRSLFPGMQGGPLMHVIAAKAVCFGEALKDEFVDYQKKVVANASALSKALDLGGFRIVSGGTDNHLFLVDLNPFGITGADAERVLQESEITVNKNTIPFDEKPPLVTSGLRIGTPAVTTRGMGEKEMEIIAMCIQKVIMSLKVESDLSSVKKEIKNLTDKFPLYG